MKNSRIIAFLLIVISGLIVTGRAKAAEPVSPEQARAQAKAHFKQGAAHYAAGRYDQALAEYQTAYELLPLPDILFNIGQVWRMKGDSARAIEYYNRYLAVEPKGRASDDARAHVTALRRMLEEERAAAGEERAARAEKQLAAERAARAAEEAKAAQERAAAEARAAEQRRAEEKLAAERAAAERLALAARATPPRPPLYKRWWLWTAVGVVAVGVGVGLGVGLGTNRSFNATRPDFGPGAAGL
jgi:tetratricopeptide (TPR) repeat protein